MVGIPQQRQKARKYILDKERFRNLLQLAKEGGEEAIRQLYMEVVYKWLKFELANWERDPHTLEDLVQEAAIKVYSALPNLRQTTPAAFYSFVRTVARRLAISRYRNQKGKDLVLISIDAQNTEDQAGDPYEEAKLAQLYAQAVDQLQQQRCECVKTLRLVASETCSIRDLSHHLGRSEGATRTHLWECRKLFRAILESLSD